MSVHFSSQKDEWETPQKLFDELDAEFGFTLDVCATKENAKCKRYFVKPVHPDHRCGLTMSWANEVCFLNPPYGRAIRNWIWKAYESSLQGATVVCLIPARTDTLYWHRWIFPYAEVRFIKGRLKFSNSKNSAPFPSAIVIFRPYNLDNPPKK